MNEIVVPWWMNRKLRLDRNCVEIKLENLHKTASALTTVSVSMAARSASAWIASTTLSSHSAVTCPNDKTKWSTKSQFNRQLDFRSCISDVEFPSSHLMPGKLV